SDVCSSDQRGCRPPQWELAFCSANDAGWSSLVARRAHNPEVAGSNPAPAIPAPHVDAGFLSAARPRARTKEPWRDRSRGRRPGSAVPSATSQAADVTGGLDWLNDSSGVQTGQVAQLPSATSQADRSTGGLDWLNDSSGVQTGQVAQLPSATSQASRSTGGFDWLNDSSGVQTGQVAQLVEHTTENRGVGSSILPLAMRQ